MYSGVASASYLLESALTVKKSNRLRQAFTVIQVLPWVRGTPSAPYTGVMWRTFQWVKSLYHVLRRS